MTCQFSSKRLLEANGGDGAIEYLKVWLSALIVREDGLSGVDPDSDVGERAREFNMQWASYGA